MEQYTFYVPILNGPGHSLIREALCNKDATLWFKCKGIPFNRWIKLTVTSISSSPTNGCHIIGECKLIFPRVLITDNRHGFTLRPFEDYAFDIKYRPDLHTGRISSIGRPAIKNPPD